jgi:DNA-binding MarR family transcriptional regulator
VTSAHDASKTLRVQLELSDTQVQQVLVGVGAERTASRLLSALRDPESTLSADIAALLASRDQGLSRSLLYGLLVLACFPDDGGDLGITELAQRLGMNASTTHRYASTLLKAGLLARDPDTRRYRLARDPSVGGRAV